MTCANHPDRERQAFCQNCGKPLCRECARTVGQAVFCEPCLEERLAAANAATFGATPPAGPAADPAYQAVSGATPSQAANPTPPNTPYTPSPIIAGFLGLIPGVGAMFNGQYAKGVAHIVIFAILVSLANTNGIFGLFITAWVFYQAFEAYHTARARRDGSPLPNPFGLNDIGERFGFGKAWPTPHTTPTAPPPAGSSRTAHSSYAPPPSPAAAPTTTPTAPPPTASVAALSPLSLREEPTRTWNTASAPPFSGAEPGYAPPPPFQPLQSVSTAQPASAPLPVGALVLVGLGILFLVGDTRWLGGLLFRLLLPALIVASGVWLFVRRMTANGGGFVDDGSAAYRLRVFSAVRGSIWIVLSGILFLLDTLRILTWGHSWPLYIIVAGVMAFLQRSTAADIRRRAADDAAFNPASQATGFRSSPVNPESER